MRRKRMEQILDARHAAVYGAVFAHNYSHETHTEKAHMKAMAAACSARKESKKHFLTFDFLASLGR